MKDFDDRKLLKMYNIENNDGDGINTEKHLSVITMNELFQMRVSDIFNPYSRICKPISIEHGFKEQSNLENKLPLEPDLENKLGLESNSDLPVLNQQTNIPLDHNGIESPIFNDDLDPNQNQNQIIPEQNYNQSLKRDIYIILAASALNVECFLLLFWVFLLYKKQQQIENICENVANEQGKIPNHLYSALQLNLPMCLKGIRRLFTTDYILINLYMLSNLIIEIELIVFKRQLIVFDRPVLGLLFTLLWRGCLICVLTFISIGVFGSMVSYNVYTQILSASTLLNISFVCSCYFYSKL